MYCELFNDVASALEGVKFYVYADDIKIYYPVKSLADCDKFQKILDDFFLWCSNNKFEINSSKCKFIRFSRKLTNINYLYTFNNLTIEECSTICDLGIRLDSKLSFNTHYDFIVSKAMKMLGFIKRFGQEFKDPYVFKTLYMTHVRSILEFATPVWSPFYQLHIDRIERIQRNFTRFAMQRLDWTDQHNIPCYEDRCAVLKLQSLENRRLMFDVMLVFDVLNGRIESSELMSLLNYNVKQYNTRSSSLLMLKTCRTNYAKNSPFNRCVNNFTKFDEHFVHGMSREAFRHYIVNQID